MPSARPAEPGRRRRARAGRAARSTRRCSRWGWADVDWLARDPRATALLAIWGAGGIALALLRPARGHDVSESRPDPGPHGPCCSSCRCSRPWPARSRVGTRGPCCRGANTRLVGRRRAGGRRARAAHRVHDHPGRAVLAAGRAAARARARDARALRASSGIPATWARCSRALGGAVAFGSARSAAASALMLVAQLARVRARGSAAGSALRRGLA